ncbi:MAG: hypothetical protein ABFS39_02490 [Pseudomonadota bacterium]
MPITEERAGTHESCGSGREIQLSVSLKPSLHALLFLALCIWQTAGFAITDTQLGSIKSLGELNGVALHCRALGETQRMKRALVLNLPKRRQLGELFDQETHKSFLNFISEQATCPSQATLAQQVDEAIRNLQAVFNKE